MNNTTLLYLRTYTVLRSMPTTLNMRSILSKKPSKKLNSKHSFYAMRPLGFPNHHQNLTLRVWLYRSVTSWDVKQMFYNRLTSYSNQLSFPESTSAT